MLDNQPIPDKPVEGSERPAQALAMEILQYVRTEFERLEKSVMEQVRVATQANAATVQRMDRLEESVRQSNQNLERRAFERAEKDVQEAEVRYVLAQKQLDRLSTQEKIQVNALLDDRDAAAQKARADKWRAFWDKITPNIASAMILAVLIPVWLAFVILILVFVLRALGIQVNLPS